MVRVFWNTDEQNSPDPYQSKIQSSRLNFAFAMSPKGELYKINLIDKSVVSKINIKLSTNSTKGHSANVFCSPQNAVLNTFLVGARTLFFCQNESFSVLLDTLTGAMLPGEASDELMNTKSIISPNGQTLIIFPGEINGTSASRNQVLKIFKQLHTGDLEHNCFVNC